MAEDNAAPATPAEDDARAWNTAWQHMRRLRQEVEWLRDDRRDTFAAAALCGLLQRGSGPLTEHDFHPFARAAFKLADAMMAERAKGGAQ